MTDSKLHACSHVFSGNDSAVWPQSKHLSPSGNRTGSSPVLEGRSLYKNHLVLTPLPSCGGASVYIT